MIRVLQLIDSLEAGGAERLAVNFANGLVENAEASFLCTTRAEGMLKDTIDPAVGYLFLKKKSNLDFNALFKLNSFVKANGINVIHAHSTSFFLATLIKILHPNIKLVWHDHFGDSEFLQNRPKGILKFCSKYFDHIFCVNQDLLKWSKKKLHCRDVSYLQNFAILQYAEPVTELSGLSGKRIICLANLRPQKDHITLFKAFQTMVSKYPDWTLHCVGKNFDDDYSQEIFDFIKHNKLDRHIFFYGSCPDIKHILHQSDIGVLASKSEGLPLSLLEYAHVGLPVIATDVGDCKKVIDSPAKGILIEPESALELADAIKRHIESPTKRTESAQALQQSVQLNFSIDAVIRTVIEVYTKKNQQ